MMKCLAETGNGWMNWKDACNLKSNQTGSPANVVHSSNLCTEIIEVTGQGETAVCNLGSINLGKYIEDGRFDFVKLAVNVRTAVKYLDRVIDINFYPTRAAKDAQPKRWRPVGLGVMGLQDAFFQLGMPFDSAQARELSKKIAEEIYFHSLSASVELASARGAHPSFPETKAAQGVFQFELWGVSPDGHDALGKAAREMVRRACATLCCSRSLRPRPSRRLSAPTRPPSRRFRICSSGKRCPASSSRSTDTSVLELKKLGLWNEEMRARIMMAEGSIQDIAEIPESLRATYRTVWEIPCARSSIWPPTAARSSTSRSP